MSSSAYSVEEDVEEHFTVHWPRHVFGLQLNAVIVVSVTFHPSAYVLPEERLVLVHDALICMVVLIRKQSAPSPRAYGVDYAATAERQLVRSGAGGTRQRLVTETDARDGLSAIKQLLDLLHSALARGRIAGTVRWGDAVAV